MLTRAELRTIAILFLPYARQERDHNKDADLLPKVTCSSQCSSKCEVYVKPVWNGRNVCTECNHTLHSLANKDGAIRMWGNECAYCNTPIAHAVRRIDKNGAHMQLQLHHSYPISLGHPATLLAAYDNLVTLANQSQFYAKVLASLDTSILAQLLFTHASTIIPINGELNKIILCITCHNYTHGTKNTDSPNTEWASR